MACLLILLTLPAFAQQSNLREGAYIKNDGTRVEGYFKQNISLKQETSIWFLPGPGAEPVRIELDSIREITVGQQEHYIVYEIPRKEYDETSLMKQVVSGAVNLFRGVSSERGTVYLWRDREDAVLLSRDNFEGFVQSVSQRCPEIEAENYRFNQGKLIELARAYGDCRFAGEVIEVFEEPAGFRFTVGLRPYWYTTTLDQAETTYYGQGMYEGDATFSAAVTLGWVVNQRLRVMLEPGYTRIKSFSDNVNVPPYSNINTFSEVTFDLQYLDLPVLVQYTFPLAGFHPFLEGGLYTSIPLKRELTDELFPADPAHIQFKPGEVRFEETHLGYTLGAGIGFPLSVDFEAALVARWTQAASSMEVDSAFREGPSFHNFRTDVLQVGLRLSWTGGK